MEDSQFSSEGMGIGVVMWMVDGGGRRVNDGGVELSQTEMNLI